MALVVGGYGKTPYSGQKSRCNRHPVDARINTGHDDFRLNSTMYVMAGLVPAIHALV